MIDIPKISIVTPSFNQGEFLEECIDSVLGQNYPNLEYIIMDGGSTDGSVEIIRKYKKYLTYWQSQPDGGQYNAINEGFKKTTGEIMAWLNSDDMYHHHAFFKMAYLFDKYEGLLWVTGRHTLWDKAGKCSHIEKNLLTFSRSQYLQKNYCSPCIQQESTFWRRYLWETAGGTLRTDLEYAGDLELWTRFFRFAPLYTIDTLIGGYRKHGNQKANLFMDRYIEEAEKVLDDEINLYNQGKFSTIFPMQDSVPLDLDELNTYIDQVYESTKYEVFKLSDNSTLVVDYLLKQLINAIGECERWQRKGQELEERLESLLVIDYLRKQLLDIIRENEIKQGKIQGLEGILESPSLKDKQ
jgi:glycosyltransferase involved in cell wall biosynthesis